MPVDRSTLIAFAGIVLFGGLNAIAVKFGNLELAPFWAAALRLLIASALLFAVVALRRLPLPRGRELLTSVIYGLVGFAAFLAFLYWGLETTPAGLTMIILAVVPLLTLFLAVAHRLERFKLASLVGSLVALAGIGLIASERLAGAGTATMVGLLAVAGGALANAETNVLVKLLPRPHPVTNNAVAMGVAVIPLLAISLTAGETWAVPQQAQTIGAIGYLAIFGSVGLFMLFLYVIERWTASATSYALLLMPVISVAAAAPLLGEPITPLLVVGGGLVLTGVYLGAFAPSRALLASMLRRPQPATVDSPPLPVTPNCP